LYKLRTTQDPGTHIHAHVPTKALCQRLCEVTKAVTNCFTSNTFIIIIIIMIITIIITNILKKKMNLMSQESWERAEKEVMYLIRTE